MLNKPTVFIGSASEGIKVANKLKSDLAKHCDVEVWNSGKVFIVNKSYLRSLLDTASLYEFAILVFTCDDKTIVRKKQYTTARDNVLFEFGLFLGKLGPRRTVALVEDNLKIPTDLEGISLDMFSRRKDGMPSATFKNTSSTIRERILDYHGSTVEFSHLPSTALAIGYFHNFISRVCDKLDNFEPITIGKKKLEYKSFTLNIVIPDKLILLDDANLKNILRGLKSVKINNSQFREFPFYMQALPSKKKPHLELFDIPTTMKASRETILRIFKEEYVGKSNLQTRAEIRETGNFEKTLRLMLEERPAWRNYISFRYLSEFV